MADYAQIGSIVLAQLRLIFSRKPQNSFKLGLTRTYASGVKDELSIDIGSNDPEFIKDMHRRTFEELRSTLTSPGEFEVKQEPPQIEAGRSLSHVGDEPTGDNPVAPALLPESSESTQQ